MAIKKKKRLMDAYGRFLLFVLSFALLLSRAAGDVSAGPLEVAADGQSPYSIVPAGEGEPERLEEAAELLRSAIEQATGADLPVVQESDFSDDAPAIYLGRSQAARDAGIEVEDITGWSYHNRVANGDIFLVGEDVEGWGRVGYFSGYAGTLKAVTAFLEEHVGVRFVFPGPWGMHVPELEKITVDDDMEESWSPLFDFVVGRRVNPRGFAGGRNYDPYAVANNYFGRYANDTEVFKSYGSHSYPNVVPREKYFETHPEYFAMQGGERNPTSRNHLCISNPDVHELLLDDMEEQFDRGYQMVMLGQSDGYRECECEECQAIHPDKGEKIWIIHRKLAEEMKKRRPDKQVVLLSYVYTAKPPKTFDSFPDNVVILTNRYVPEYFRAWEDWDVPHIVYLPKWLGRNRPGSPRYEVDQVRLFLENNVIGIYLGGGLDCGSGSSWGLYGPRYYAFGKAMGDPTLDADELVREWAKAAFGAAAGPRRTVSTWAHDRHYVDYSFGRPAGLLEFFSLWHRRMEVFARFDRMGVGIDRSYRGYPFSMKPADTAAHILAPGILKEMSGHLNRALDLAEEEDEKVRARVELVELEFRFLKSSAIMQHLYRAYRAAPSWELLDAIESHVESHREMLQLFQPREDEPDKHEVHWPGGRRWALRTPFNTYITGAPGMPGDAPYGWNFDEIRQSGELPDADVRIRLRGGDMLEPYDPDPPVEKRLQESAGEPLDDYEEDDDGFFDPEIDAPFDL